MHAQLKSLEQKLEELIRLTHNLRGENFALRQKLVLVENDRQELKKKGGHCRHEVNGIDRA